MGIWSYVLAKVFGPRQQLNVPPPTVAWILAHREQLREKAATTRGATPSASLYRMYEYFVAGHVTGLRTEIETFFNQPAWAVCDIPDPKDADPERYAVLAVLTFYLKTACNRLIERGLPRGSPAIIVSDEVEDDLRSCPVVLEEEPKWALEVPKLENILLIPAPSGSEPDGSARSDAFLAKNIIAEEPHVLFV